MLRSVVAAVIALDDNACHGYKSNHHALGLVMEMYGKIRGVAVKPVSDAPKI